MKHFLLPLKDKLKKHYSTKPVHTWILVWEKGKESDLSF